MSCCNSVCSLERARNSSYDDLVLFWAVFMILESQ
jgi:hypothetical protein